MTRTDLLGVLARASTPGERLVGGWLRPLADEGASGARRFDAWCRAVADGDPVRIDAILAARGLTADDWQRALNDVEAVADEPLPAWARHASALLQRCGEPAAPAPVPTLGEVVGDGLPAWVDADQPWRFHAGFANWTADARADVRRWLRQADVPHRPELVEHVALGLPRRMLGVVGPTLMREAEQLPGLLASQPQQDWRDLWRRFPLLARLMATVWRQWRASTAELITRIGADRDVLAPGQAVTDISIGAGDQHGDGRAVAAVTFADGRVWFCKPKPLGPEAVLARMHAVLAGHDGEVAEALRLPDHESRAGYSWVAQVHRSECTDAGDVARYFWRAGASLRILQLLGATDLHHENFIATCAGMVLVDLETAIGSGGGWAAAEVAADDPMANTPAATSMVTSMVDGPPGRASIDIGALAGPETRLTPYETSRLELTAQGPQLARARVPFTNGSALPVLDGAPVPVRDYTSQVRAGYGAAQAAATATAAELAAALDDAGEAQVRFVARPTQVYVRLLSSSTSGAALTDGAERALVLERLWRAFGTCPSAVIDAEVTAMTELDVPMFTAGITGRDLFTDRGTRLREVLARAPADEARTRLVALAHPTAATEAESDLRAALFAVDPQAPAQGHLRRTAASALDTAALLALALQQLVTVGRRARRSNGAHPVWCGLQFDPSRSRWRHQRLGSGLLGTAGIGLALVVAGDTAGGVLGDEAVDLGIATLSDSAARSAAMRLTWDAGDAFTGPAGTLYALAKAVAMRDEPPLTAAAARLVPTVETAAASPVASPTIDQHAGSVLALRAATAAAVPGAAEALSRMVGDGPEPLPENGQADDHPADRWSADLPSAAAGRALAWPAEIPVLPAGSLPGDRQAAAALGSVPSSDEWRALAGNADGGSDHLTLASLAATCARTTGEDIWWRRHATHLGVLAADHAATGRYVPDIEADERRNLSVVHGLAAIVLTASATHPKAPDVRVLR